MIPATLAAGLERYLRHGIVPGAFLHAVLRNDLHAAVRSADPDSLAALPDIVRYVYRDMTPASCCGSPEAVQRWVAAHNGSKVRV